MEATLDHDIQRQNSSDCKPKKLYVNDRERERVNAAANDGCPSMHGRDQNSARDLFDIALENLSAIPLSVRRRYDVDINTLLYTLLHSKYVMWESPGNGRI